VAPAEAALGGVPERPVPVRERLVLRRLKVILLLRGAVDGAEDARGGAERSRPREGVEQETKNARQLQRRRGERGGIVREAVFFFVVVVPLVVRVMRRRRHRAGDRGGEFARDGGEGERGARARVASASHVFPRTPSTCAWRHAESSANRRVTRERAKKAARSEVTRAHGAASEAAACASVATRSGSSASSCGAGNSPTGASLRGTCARRRSSSSFRASPAHARASVARRSAARPSVRAGSRSSASARDRSSGYRGGRVRAHAETATLAAIAATARPTPKRTRRDAPTRAKCGGSAESETARIVPKGGGLSPRSAARPRTRPRDRAGREWRPRGGGGSVTEADVGGGETRRRQIRRKI
jgi:hypothetical protein